MPVRGERQVTANRWLSRFAALVLGTFLLTASPCDARELSGQSTIEQVEAAYLYKFVNYVEWPEGAFGAPNSPIVIGVIGADTLAAELDQLVKGRMVKGRHFITHRLRHGDPMDGVHVLFIGALDDDDVEKVLDLVRGKPVLTVSDSRQAHDRGSMINFVTVDQRVRFEVALPPVAQSRLRLSALLLTVAYRVEKGTQ